MNLPKDRGHIDTEKINKNTLNMHQYNIKDCLMALHTEDKSITFAIEKALPDIKNFIEELAIKFKAGGRLIYFGAGTSGRLGVLDASEIPPTFQFEENRIIGIIAGGDSSLRKSSEGKEDDQNGAIAELEKLNINGNDSVLGIAAGGTTPYVHGALKYSKKINEKVLTGLLTCSRVPMEAYIDHLIFLETGPEVLTGSTRMKAGTATKMVLNMISTTLMIQLGRVYQNLMVDLRATNEKLVDRAIRILIEITGEKRDVCFSLLKQADLKVKTAIVMHKKGCDKKLAEELLNKNDNRLDFLDKNI